MWLNRLNLSVQMLVFIYWLIVARRLTSTYILIDSFDIVQMLWFIYWLIVARRLTSTYFVECCTDVAIDCLIAWLIKWLIVARRLTSTGWRWIQRGRGWTGRKWEAGSWRLSWGQYFCLFNLNTKYEFAFKIGVYAKTISIFI